MNTPRIFTKQNPLFSVLTVCLFVWAISMAGCSRSSSDAYYPTPDNFQAEAFVLDEFQDLIDYIDSLTTKLSDEQRDNLSSKVSDASDVYKKGDPCKAADILSDYLEMTQGIRKDELIAIAEDLHNRGYFLNYNMLLSLLETCSGYEGFGRPPKVQISESNNEHMKGSFTFGVPKMWTAEDGDEVFTQIQLPGIPGPIGGPGLPAVPLYHRLIAVPRGAGVQITGTAHEGKTIYLNLYPVQTQPMDSDEENPLFVKDDAVDDAVYDTDTNALFPGKALSVKSVGYIRDVQIAEITCATGQYNPLNDTFTPYDSVDFEVEYTGGTGNFLTEESDSPFDSTLTMVDGLVMNSDILVGFGRDDDINDRVRNGEEFLILTHQNFLAAANSLAEWKNEQGIITRVHIVNDADTAEAIDDLIEHDYNECLVRPSYVLLLGDAEFIPTFYVEDYRNPERPLIASDYPYADVNDEGNLIGFMFPDIGVGRISVDKPEEANIVVNKIIAYEETPPKIASFYENATVVSQFQCCREEHTGWDQRTFVEASEFTRDVLLNHGYTVERIYTQTDSSTTPRRYFDGTHLPVDLGLYSDFPWDGDTQDIIDAFTDPAGRFLITHRDHGSAEGWIHPSFTVDNIHDDLGGGQDPALLPVVFSINCSSGLFDNETCPVGECYFTNSDGIYFCEALLRKAGGGAVGAFGATRGSPSWPNTYLMKGMTDAIWPDAIPDFGGDTPQRRLGDILNHGKLYMLGQMGAYMDVVSELWPGDEDMAIADTLNDFNLFHCFGDPTLEIWTSAPSSLPGLGDIEQQTEEGLNVTYGTDGATITVYQEGDDGIIPLGRAKVVDGSADIDYIQDPDPDLPLIIFAGKTGCTGALWIANYTITASADPGGTISPRGSTTVNYGGNQTYTFTPVASYKVDTVTVDGETTTVTGNNYTFMNVTDDHTIHVTFGIAGLGTMWSKTYGHGEGYCEYHTYGLDATNDGGYVFAAENQYNASDKWEADFWVVRLDSDGGILWEQGFGGGDSGDYPEVVRQTADGGFIVAGKSYSFRIGDRYCDIWVIKLNSSGGIVWQHNYGGTGYDVPMDLQETFNSQGTSTGYILAGYTTSFGAGGYDIWVVKLGTSGEIVWQKTYGGTNNEFGRSIQQVFDQGGNPDGYVMAADTQSFGAGDRDAWVLKLGNSGTVEWERAYGGSGLEMPQSIQVADDGGYVVGARTESFGAGEDDFWAFKIDAGGNLVWQYTYGGLKIDTIQDLKITQDHGYIMTGWTLSFGVNSYDAWVVKLTDAGAIAWQKSYNIIYDSGSLTWSGDEWAYGVAQADDGGYVIAGDSDAMDDRSSDVWIFKIDSAGSLGCDIETDTNAVPTPTTASTKTTACFTNDTVTVAGTPDCIHYNTAADVFTQCSPQE